MPRPLIVITNDDGVRSPGLLAAVRALRGLGEIMVVAPREQQSSSGRAFYWNKRPVLKSVIQIGRQRIQAFAVDASPAVTMRHALLLIVPRKPALVVSGINFGENLGSGLTISGTVGAALEAAAEGVPALAISLETAKEFHMTHSATVDFSTAAHWTRWMAERILAHAIPENAPLVNINVPSEATDETPWRVTRASHQAYFRSLVENGKFIGYDVVFEREKLERDSDIYAVRIDRVVSVTPLTYDLTARVNFKTFAETLTKKLDAKRKRT
jgi:5'-nucleotidase